MFCRWVCFQIFRKSVPFGSVCVFERIGFDFRNHQKVTAKAVKVETKLKSGVWTLLNSKVRMWNVPSCGRKSAQRN